jgi:hypothetical protein
MSLRRPGLPQPSGSPFAPGINRGLAYGLALAAPFWAVAGWLLLRSF